ncbi:MAG: hypothetical protein PHO57_07065 [Acidithiobacillus sp.]|nr:hypothetical protein [Acidithiobacillus sp.]
MIWLFAGSSITKLALVAGGVALLAGPLNGNQTWVAGQSRYMPPKAIRLASTANVNRLHRLPNGGVVVDLECWPMTPKAQQRHPVAAYRKAAILAAKRRQWLVGTPATDLVHSVDPAYRGKLYSEFLRLDLAGRIAPFVSVYEIQAQGLERNPARYAWFVRQVAAQVHAGNPRASILAGLSTNPGGHAVSSAVLVRDVVETKGVVNGYEINIPQAGRSCPSCGTARPEVAAQLLRKELG